MPASCTALTVVAAPSSPAGASHDEQQSDAAPGNRWANSGRSLASFRNTNAAARIVSFYADQYGVEAVIMTSTVPGSATENGTKIMGPFAPSKFNNHNTTEVATTGQIHITHNGADADLMICPFELNMGLFEGIGC